MEWAGQGEEEVKNCAVRPCFLICGGRGEGKGLMEGRVGKMVNSE